ncbi:MAG: hypothetical protein LBB81_05765 [Treponema sp.]|jgi:hypothetical protein|nr:hypothetical protein [Treponema sp.]
MKNIKTNGVSFTAAKLKAARRAAAISVIALIAVIGFSFATCGKGKTNGGSSAKNSSAESGSKSSSGGAAQTFTSITAFKEWFEKQPDNTAGSAYNVRINISDLGGVSGDSGSLGAVLISNEKSTSILTFLAVRLPALRFPLLVVVPTLQA